MTSTTSKLPRAIGKITKIPDSANTWLRHIRKTLVYDIPGPRTRVTTTHVQRSMPTYIDVLAHHIERSLYDMPYTAWYCNYLEIKNINDIIYLLGLMPKTIDTIIVPTALYDDMDRQMRCDDGTIVVIVDGRYIRILPGDVDTIYAANDIHIRHVDANICVSYDILTHRVNIACDAELSAQNIYKLTTIPDKYAPENQNSNNCFYCEEKLTILDGYSTCEYCDV